MIYTITLNPSLDLISILDELKPGRTNLATNDSFRAGGRAITVSQILSILDIPSTATGFVGGHTGAFIEEELSNAGISNQFVHIADNTRIDVSIFDNDVETRVLGRSTIVTVQEINDLMFYLSRIREGDYIVLAGSLPKNVSADLYDRMIDIAVVNGANFLPIINAEYLPEVLSKKPLLITPTVKELSEMLEEDLRTKQDILRAGLTCIDMGAQNVIINQELAGSLLITSERKTYEAQGPGKKVVSSTHTDMTLAAGFIGDYMRINDPKEAFKLAQAVSNATYYVRSLPSLEDIREEIDRVDVLPLN
ncbi:1-phosphofructokinase family hexose kinase [Kallipyga massiliensis]|uniref:1-phosphofructokinase family hexose kinase n=1 Tax=Kallipyga massiliensis TaxID=1472764 RepID=UPI0026E9D2D2|nr:hexose kinase [Kallipyga massiliensis]